MNKTPVKSAIIQKVWAIKNASNIYKIDDSTLNAIGQ